ncbi:MAG: L,D-transpeptidase [Clostridiaceae bacterium]
MPMNMKSNWKKAAILLLAITMIAAFAGCSSPEEAVPEATATPEVAIITAAPVITNSDPYTLPIPATEAIPAGYTAVQFENASVSLFAFTNKEGTVQYRVFGGYSELTDGVETKTFTGFYPSDETGALLNASDGFVDPAVESFGVCTPSAMPESFRLKTGYQALETIGVYADANGAKYVYGSFSEGEGAFYPANADGTMIPGALKATADIAVPAYLPETPPETEGERMLIVYIGTQSVVCFKAENGEWTEERVMICSTGRSKKLTPRGEFALMRQYLYKKMGQVHGENVYSQYASRITGSYLFHSVPIGGEDRYSQENGKRQMFVEYYERLGTPASGGCVRLRCADAYWVYMTCPIGTKVIITDDSGPQPPKIPALIYEEPYMDKKHELGWDPSDPDPENPYHAIYPPEFVITTPVEDKSVDDKIEDTGN